MLLWRRLGRIESPNLASPPPRPPSSLPPPSPGALKPPQRGERIFRAINQSTGGSFAAPVPALVQPAYTGGNKSSSSTLSMGARSQASPLVGRPSQPANLGGGCIRLPSFLPAGWLAGRLQLHSAQAS